MSRSKDPERTHVATTSDIPVERVYTEADREAADVARDLGAPGEFPFTRGVQPTMYRGRLWTMRQYAGFGTARRDERALPLPARRRARPGCRWPSICRRRSATTPTTRWREGEVGKVGVAISIARRHGGRCSTGSRSTRSPRR